MLLQFEKKSERTSASKNWDSMGWGTEKYSIPPNPQGKETQAAESALKKGKSSEASPIHYLTHGIRQRGKGPLSVGKSFFYRKDGGRTTGGGGEKRKKLWEVFRKELGVGARKGGMSVSTGERGKAITRPRGNQEESKGQGQSRKSGWKRERTFAKSKTQKRSFEVENKSKTGKNDRVSLSVKTVTLRGGGAKSMGSNRKDSRREGGE